jgi:hypothetical protein
LFGLVLGLLGILGCSFVLHLFELNAIPEFKVEFFEQISEDDLVDLDGFVVGFIKVDPDFDPVAGGIAHFGSDEAEAVNFLASFKVLAQEEEGELFIDLFLVGLTFGDLEDEPATFLILLVFPFGFDALPEELDGVDFAPGFANEIAA